MKVIIKPLEEYRLGLRQSSGIIIENVDVVSAFLSPTTILGIIGKLKNVSPLKKPGIDDLKDAYYSLTQNELKYVYHSDSPLTWGPLIRDEMDKKYYPLLFSKLILDVKKYIEYAINSFEGIITESIIRELRVQTRRMNQLNRSNRTTIHSFYQKFFSNEYALEYCVNIKENIKGVSMLGGENRYAEVCPENCECDYGEGDYAILLQPLLFETEETYFTKLSNVKGFQCVDEIYGVVVEKGNHMDFKVKTTYYALGYGNERRPMLRALPPGTVIKVKEECEDAKALGILSELGFGAIYRIRLQS
ncbi:hypothetical protein [Acidianus sp. HS-5]|uniref:hypothetical protein n=1 Tax=Acidianus sp. HS-5 TaxID=2886040 RepID=UPI001F302AAE|nr:hypothetical protein [Acidianus sp. HS-5]BDC18766.1 hypothetical protein HS5_16560 [Acidianus sp. HS-5]